MFATLKVILAFLWEVFMGKDSFRNVYKKDKKRVWLFIVLVSSLSLNVLSIKRLVNISKKHVLFVQEMEAKGYIDKTQGDPVLKATQIVENAVATTEASSEPTTPNTERESTPKNNTPTTEYNRADELLKALED